MCRNCDEFGICQNKCVLEKNVYVTVGRVSGNEDILMFIDAYNPSSAKEMFLENVKREQNWDDEDIYIEFCVSLSTYKKHYIYTNSGADTLSYR